MALLACFASLFVVIFVIQFINQLGVSMLYFDQSLARLIHTRQSEMIMLYIRCLCCMPNRMLSYIEFLRFTHNQY